MIIFIVAFSLGSLKGSASDFVKPDAIVRGVVLDSYSQPLQGVTVSVKGTARGTITNQNGEFQIDVSRNETLVFTFLGYEAQEFVVTNLTAAINVVMTESANNLDEVVVVGYGTMRRRDLTGAIGSVRGEDVQRASTATLQDAIQGRLAGVQVITTDGSPGGGVQIKIRGGSTLTAGNQPLYVIDGFPLTPSLSPDFNPLGDISPSDITSIDILKDASATAIYGAEGANGVVLITTKKGRANSKPVIDVGTYYGVSLPIKALRILTPEEYLKYKVEILTQNPEQIATIPGWLEKDPSEGKIWMDEIVRTGSMFNSDLGIRGGSNNGTIYSANVNYYNEQGIIKESEYSGLSERVNLDQDIGKKLKFGIKMFYSQIGQNGFMQEYNRESSLFKQAHMMSPFSQGIPTQIVTDYTPENEQNNMDNNLNALIYNSIKERKLERFQPSLNAQYKLVRNLTLNFTYGQDRFRSDYGTFYPSSTRQGYPLGRAQIVNSKTNNWYQNTRLNYNTTLAKIHRIDAVLVYETKSANDYVYDQSATGFATDVLGLGNFQLANTLTKPQIDERKQNYISYVGRVNYGFDSRYLVTLTYRRDGSSKFGGNNPWANFPAAGLAWNVSNEKFLKGSDVVSNLKVRYGWGVTGNSQIPPYSSLALFETDLTVFNNDFYNIIYPANIGNRDLKWETTTQHNLGLDLGLLKNRISLIVDAYDKLTRDLLFNVQLPAATGYTVATQNIGSIRNKGLEFTLNTLNIDRQVNWRSDLNLSLNRSKILKLGQSSMQLYSYQFANSVQNNVLLKEGYPIGVFFGYVGNGGYNTIAETENAPINTVIPKSGRDLLGEMRFEDINGDGYIDAYDRVPIAFTEPKFIGGMVHNVSYKNVDFTISFRGSYGNDIINANIGDFAEMSLSTNNLKGNVDNMWRPKQPMLDYIGVTKTGRRAHMHSEYVEDGSYLRCDRISIGYLFNKKALRRIKMNNLRAYFNVRNAFLITNYSWYDPEVSTGSANNQKLAPGVDLGSYPRTRQFQIGLNASL